MKKKTVGILLIVTMIIISAAACGKEKTSDDKKETSSHASPASRKTVIEHVRRAHWHHYWVGKQNTDERKLILHWIPPTLVRGTKCDAAVIHKVN